MKREDHSLSNWTTQRIKKRMLKGILDENLFINGLAEKKQRSNGRQALWFKAAVLFLAIFSFSVIKNSDFGDYHSLPALPLARTMTLPADRQPSAPLAVGAKEAGSSYKEYQPFMNQDDFPCALFSD